MKWYVWLSIVLLALGLCSLQGTVVFPDPDAFYHVGVAQHLWEFGFAKTFSGLQPTTLGQHFVDQHFLLHFTLAPFVWMMSPGVGTKVYMVVVVLVCLSVMSYMLYWIKAQTWWVGVMLLVATNAWLFRINLVKATPLALILLFLSLLALQTKKYKWLLLIGGLYVWTHGGFILLPILVGVWSLLAKQWKPVAYVLCGISVAILVHPAFPNNLLFYWEQLVQIGAVNYQTVIGVGGEWYPYEPGSLVFGHTIIFSILIISLVLHVLQRRPFTVAQICFSIYTVIFFILTLKSKRYVEYFSPMLACTAALYVPTVIKSKVETHNKVETRHGMSLLLIPTAIMIVVLVPVVIQEIITAKTDLQSGQALTYLHGAGEFLDTLPPGQVVAPSDWDDFPALWRAAPHQQFLIGLDPTFLYLANPTRYEAWRALTLGEDNDVDTVGADYYVVAKDHKSMHKHLVKIDAVTVYEDDEAWVLTTP